MTEEQREELRELQRRAYGPRADIHRDAAAMQRLRDLERVVANLQNGGAAQGTVLQEDAAAARPSPEDGGDPTTSTVDEPHASAAPSTSTPPARRWWRLRRGTTWAVSLTCAFVLGACAVTIVSPFLPASTRPVATLAETSEPAWPEFLGAPPSRSRSYTEYHGMTVLATGPKWNGLGSDDCLIVLPTSEAVKAAPMTRSVEVGCGTDEFPATVQFNVAENLPDELVARHPTGSALQFVLTPSGVDVLTR